MERSLKTILVSDIVGFSLMMGRNEEQTLRLLQSQRSLVIDPLLQTHRGRIANTAGDSMLVELPSAADAVQFAVGMQTQLEKANQSLPTQEQMIHRIGINIGDVIPDGDDLLGDGLNIAARLEAIAPAGGIVISRSVKDQIQGKLQVELNDLHDLELKNIDHPVHAFQVVRDGEALMRLPRRSSKMPLWMSLAAAILLAGSFLFWVQPREDFAPIEAASMALPLPDKPSVVVMPFANLSDNSENDWVGDGLTENIISTLALSPDMVVIGRATSFSLRDRQLDIRDIAQELGVRYVLSGSIQTAADQIRVTAELSDAIQGRQIWSIKEDAEISDLFAVQDQIAQKLFLEMKASLTVGEAGRAIDALAGDFETSIRVIRGRAEFQKFSPEGHIAAERIWSAIVTENPDSPLGPFLMGWISFQKVILGLSSDPAIDFALAQERAKKSLEMHEFADPYALLATLYSNLARYDEAIEAANKAIQLAPGGADSNAIGGDALYNSGEVDAGLKHMLKGMRLEPDYPEWLPASLYPALLERNHYQDTITLAKSVLSKDVQDTRAKREARIALIAAYSLLGDLAEARSAADSFVEEYGMTTADDLSSQVFREHKSRAFHQDFLNALARASLTREN
ncbi:MAG: hypothetical protein HRU33_12105 [Rhodobacteraceae bacterium]|nr:hypothetical protein [Paracoccaceae bacterium]